MIPLFLSAILLFSCQKAAEPPAREPARTSMVQASPGRTSPVNEELLHITEDAQNTLSGFFRHLTRPGPTEKHFSIKYPFTADEDSGVDKEQLWLTGLHFKNGIYYGIIANNPRHITGLKKGDKVIFDTGGITDWMYVRNGKIIGGESIKYLVEQIPERQRSESERELLGMFYY